jgi:hypothetical protein
MEFLRRLDPRRTAAPGAARLDVAPRWLEPTTTPTAAESARPAESAVAPTARPMRPPVVLQSEDRETEASGRPSVGTGETVPAAGPRPSRPAPQASFHAKLDRSMQAASALPITEGRPSYAASNGAGAQVGIAPPRRTAAAEAGPLRRTAPLPPAQTQSPVVPDRPLRADALSERRPRPASEPPIVHVTIDRIDVRLPAVDAAPSPRERRPRAASAVRPLSEYLRGGGRG